MFISKCNHPVNLETAKGRKGAQIMQKDRSSYIKQTTYTLSMCRNLWVADIKQSLITMETLFTEGFTVVSLPNELCSELRSSCGSERNPVRNHQASDLSSCFSFKCVIFTIYRIVCLLLN